jgi:hypothetical protein
MGDSIHETEALEVVEKVVCHGPYQVVGMGARSLVVFIEDVVHY